jgi:hypothetical protein
MFSFAEFTARPLLFLITMPPNISREEFSVMCAKTHPKVWALFSASPGARCATQGINPLYAGFIIFTLVTRTATEVVLTIQCDP